MMCDFLPCLMRRIVLFQSSFGFILLCSMYLTFAQTLYQGEFHPADSNAAHTNIPCLDCYAEQMASQCCPALLHPCCSFHVAILHNLMEGSQAENLLFGIKIRAPAHKKSHSSPKICLAALSGQCKHEASNSLVRAPLSAHSTHSKLRFSLANVQSHRLLDRLHLTF